MGNRVEKAIETLRERVAKLSTKDAAALDATMAISFTEHFEFQQQQARAHAVALISAEEAQTIYMALGEVGSQKNGGWAAGTDTATKCAVTKLMAELLAMSLRVSA